MEVVKQYSKRGIAILLVVVVLTMSVCVFAANINGKTFGPISFKENEPTIWLYRNGRQLSIYANNDDVYMFYVGNLNGNTLNLQWAYAFTYSADRTVYYTDQLSNYTYNLNYNSTYNVYLASVQGGIDGTINNEITYNVYNSFESAMADISQGISPDSPGVRGIVPVPAGNVAYIDISGISNWDGFTLTTQMPESSSLLGPPWWNSTQKWGFASSLPSDGSTVSGLSNVDWAKASNGGLLGQTKNASFSPVGPFQSANYLVIYNPLYFGGTANGPYEWLDNATVFVNVHANSVKVYPLNSSVGPGDSGTGSAEVDTVIDGDPYDGEIDPDTGEISWSQNDEESTGPQTGGANEPGVKNTINDWLENIATQISNFFNGAIGAVNTLTVAIRNFVDILKGLYIWLPGPVYNILSSAIMLAITIGVVKVFI